MYHTHPSQHVSCVSALATSHWGHGDYWGSSPTTACRTQIFSICSACRKCQHTGREAVILISCWYHDQYYRDLPQHTQAIETLRKCSSLFLCFGDEKKGSTGGQWLSVAALYCWDLFTPCLTIVSSQLPSKPKLQCTVKKCGKGWEGKMFIDYWKNCQVKERAG